MWLIFLVMGLGVELILAFHFRGNAKWPFSLSHNRLQTGGWARQQNGMSYMVTM